MVDTRNSAKGVDGKNGGRPLKSILKKLGNRPTVNVNEEITVGLNKGTVKNTTAGGVAQQYNDVNTKIVDESPSTVQRCVTMAPVVMVHNFEVDYGACITESNGANDGQLVGVAAVMDSNNMGINGTNTGTKSKRAVEVEVVVQQPRDSINADKVGTDDEHNENHILEGAEYMVKGRYDNSLVGFFVGKGLAFPEVQNYVNNDWSKFGLEKLMRNDDGVYLFKFSSKLGMEQALIEVSLDSKLKKEVIMNAKVLDIAFSCPNSSYKGRCSLTPSVVATVLGSMEDHEEGFVEINRRKKKRKAGSNQHCQISGIKLSKPKSNFQYRPVFKPGKDMDDASNLGAIWFLRKVLFLSIFLLWFLVEDINFVSTKNSFEALIDSNDSFTAIKASK
ncbi:hypothetical protein Tco_0961424 [Tanacetum coccineum]